MADRTSCGGTVTCKIDGHGESEKVVTSDLLKVSDETVVTKGETAVDPNRVDSLSDATTSHTTAASSSSPTISSTSLPNFLRVPAWEDTTKLSTAASSTLSTRSSAASRSTAETAAIKTEEDIKVYVETTMNELLGWYGLPKMDNTDTTQLTMNHYPASLSQRSPSRPNSASSTPTATTSTTTTTTLTKRKLKAGNETDRSLENKLSSDTNNNSSSCGADDEEDDDDVGHDGVDDGAEGGADIFQDSFVSGHDGGGLMSPVPGEGEVSDSERGLPIICSWCQRNGNKLFTLETSSGNKSFCSELCFTQCRRASFKRNKVCEWCKHVRHTLNFVDFQDGDVQLQFCSEKCLNQYKMNIFCTEARQHLQHIQSMSSEDVKKTMGKGNNREKDILITPELWLSAHSYNKVAIKQEINEDEQEKLPDSVRDSKGGPMSFLNGIEPGEVLESDPRWASGVERCVKTALSDHSCCSNDDTKAQKSKSSQMSRQRKDRSASRVTTLKNDTRTSSDSFHQDRDRINKLLTGTDFDSHSQNRSSSAVSMKDRTDLLPGVDTQKSITFPTGLGGASFSQQQLSGLSLLPNWATPQLLTMIPPQLSSSLAAANINSSLGGLGYVPNSLLFSSLFAPSSLSMTSQKESLSGLARSVHESRRELLRDRPLAGERGNIRGESTERSTRSTSSSYSSSDTPGPPSTPDVSIGTGPEPCSSFVPGFSQQSPHPVHTRDPSQPLTLSSYFTEQQAAGMFPLFYGMNHSQRSGISSLPFFGSNTSLPHPPPPPSAPTAQPQHQPASVPPVTILVPYPVAVPIPVPIPIPLPIAPEKLFAFFKEKSAQAKPTPSTSSAQQWPTDHRRPPSLDERSKASSVSHPVNISPVVSPQIASKSLTLAHHPYASFPTLNSTDPTLVMPSGRESADSIMTLRREIGGLHQKAVSLSPCSSSSLRHTSLSSSHFRTGRSKKARLDIPSNEDEAIDLSKISSRSSSPRVSENCSEQENTTCIKQASLSDSDMDSSSQTSTIAVPSVPRIHIVSDPSKPPLCQPSLAVTSHSPQQQSSYSDRRSRILDAPSVPKKMRSPSPERRYIRTVPRDMVEAARRRGLRARVRSK